MKEAGFGVLLAIQFLTRLPVSLACPWTPGTRRWAARVYPLVGMLIGSLVAAVGTLLEAALRCAVDLGPAQPVGGADRRVAPRWPDGSGRCSGQQRTTREALGDHEGPPGRQLRSAGAGVSPGLEGGTAVDPAGRRGEPWWLVPVIALGRLAAVGLLISVPAARAEGLAHAWQRSLGRGDLVWAVAPVLVLLALMQGSRVDPGAGRVRGALWPGGAPGFRRHQRRYRRCRHRRKRAVAAADGVGVVRGLTGRAEKETMGAKERGR